MSRAGARAKREQRWRQSTAEVRLRRECPTCHLGMVVVIRGASSNAPAYADVHAVTCGCTPGLTGGSFCNFGDGWLDAA